MNEACFDLKKIVFIAIIIAIFCTGVFLRYQSLFVPYRHGPDEIVYGLRAYQILIHGKAASIQGAKEFVQNKKMWFYPPPTRIGYLLPLTWVMKITSQYNFLPGLFLSLFASIGTLMLLIIMGVRFFNRETLLAALTMYAVCPISIMLAGRAFQDSFVGFLGLLLVYLASEIISNQNKKIWYALFVIIGSYTLLVKTSLFVFFGLCALIVLVFLNFEKIQFKKSMIFSVFILLGFIISMLILGSWSGGLKNILLIWYYIKEGVKHNSYAIYQTVSINKFLFNFYINSAITSVLFVLALLFFAFSTFFKKQNICTFEATNNKNVYMAILSICILFFLVTALTPHFQNIRYVIMLFVPIYLFAGYSITTACRHLIIKSKKQYMAILFIIATIIIILLGSLRDYRVYQKLFVKYHLYDPAPVFMMALYNK
jgi:hypothetical protein